MEQSILDAAALATERLGRALAIKIESQQDSDFLEGYNKGYCHGAEWQKEQYKEMIEELKTTHEFLLSLYKAIDIRPDRLDLKSIQQDLRDRMAKQLQLIDKATK